MLFTKRVVDPRAEIRVQPYLPDLAPRLIDSGRGADGKTWMRFEYLEGRHADLSPGSTDLPAVLGMLEELSRTVRAELPVLPAAERWAAFGGTDHLAGDTLVHTDLCSENILMTGDGLRLVDWEWPTRGAAWLDSASMMVRLVQAGHGPQAALELVTAVPAFRDAEPAAIRQYLTAREAVARRGRKGSLAAAYRAARAAV